MEGSAATCAELTDINNLNRATIKVQEKLRKSMTDPEEIKKVEALEQKLEKQVTENACACNCYFK